MAGVVHAELSQARPAQAKAKQAKVAHGGPLATPDVHGVQ
jgi:hypothetical protein